MREIFETLGDELRRRLVNGETEIDISDESLKILRKLASADDATLDEVKAVEFADASDAVKAVEDIKYEQKKKIVVSKKIAEQNIAGIAPIPEPTPFALPEGTKQQQWDFLREKVLSDPVCKEHLHPNKQIVFGVGNLDAKIFFCGEAPGADEETQGEPFVGKAGQLLTKIIAAMGLSREEVYIGNIMNWRPETPRGNRPPTETEMAYCLPYLKAQIKIVRPQVVVALGMTAVSGLLGFDPARKMGKIRGVWHSFENTDLMPTYHPSFLLQYASNQMKRLVWEDMMSVMERVGMEISEKQRGFFLQK